jgi:hypothetical protein
MGPKNTPSRVTAVFVFPKFPTRSYICCVWSDVEAGEEERSSMLRQPAPTLSSVFCDLIYNIQILRLCWLYINCFVLSLKCKMYNT